jgi:hypothetical protein
MLRRLRSLVGTTWGAVVGWYPERFALRAVAAAFTRQYGYVASVRAGRPIDAEGLALPWFTYPAIECLDALALGETAVFEWGSGHSSDFFAERCASIESVESDSAWYARVSATCRSNQHVVLIDADDPAYVTAIERGAHPLYGLIIVDGKRRTQCAAAARRHLAPGGILLLDNADWFPRLCESLRAHGLLQLDFHGFGPINPYASTTALFIDITSGAPAAPLLNRRGPYRGHPRAGLRQVAADDGHCGE